MDKKELYVTIAFYGLVIVYICGMAYGIYGLIKILSDPANKITYTRTNGISIPD